MSIESAHYQLLLLLAGCLRTHGGKYAGGSCDQDPKHKDLHSLTHSPVLLLQQGFILTVCRAEQGSGTLVQRCAGLCAWHTCLAEGCCSARQPVLLHTQQAARAWGAAALVMPAG